MFSQPMAGANRFFCGRIHRPPLRVLLLDKLRWHQELYYLKGETVVRRRWVRSRGPGRSIYTCRKPMTHWKVTLKPAGLRWVTAIHDTKGAEVPAHIQNRRSPYWAARAQKITRKQERIQIPTESWELGHRYEFTRWEER